jgi:hypothetical protein
MPVSSSVLPAKRPVFNIESYLVEKRVDLQGLIVGYRLDRLPEIG